jgi:uncharacterized NAD-dependent epimerase/dehydratase family protein
MKTIATTTALTACTGIVNGTSFKGVGTRYTMQCIGTFSATIELEGSVDDTNWRSLASLTGPDATMVADEFYPRLRVICSAYTSGTMDTCYVCQQDEIPGY